MSLLDKDAQRISRHHPTITSSSGDFELRFRASVHCACGWSTTIGSKSERLVQTASVLWARHVLRKGP